MENERKLEKVGKNTFKLIVDDKEHKLRTEKTYERKELREIYQQVKAQLEQLKAAKQNNEKELSKLDVKDEPQLREFAEKVEMAMKLTQYDKLMEQKNKILKDLDLFKNQMKEISSKVPEVLRK